MKILLSIFFVCILNSCIHAQADTLTVYKIREFGVNTTPLLQQFISIGNIDNLSQSRAFMFKRFKPNKKRGLRFGLGLHFDEQSFFQENQVVHISLGSERRRVINENWFYYFGYDFFVNSRPFGERTDTFGSGLGFDVVLGVVYQINKHLSLSTETTLAASIGDGFKTQISPPLSLYFNFRTFKQKYY